MSGFLQNAPTSVSFVSGVKHSERKVPTKPIPFQSASAQASTLLQGLHVPFGNSALSLIERTIPIQRRLMRQGDVIYGQGDAFSQIYVVNTGNLKLLTRETDGRERIAKFRFKGDWLGLDGLFASHYSCDAICMDTGEVWGFTYPQLIHACEYNKSLLDLLLRTVSYELSEASDQTMMLCTLPTQARVAQFLCYWVEALRHRQLRTDQITLRLSREEMGSHLGMTLESVSRSLCLLERRNLIEFIGKGRREISIPNVAALVKFIQGKAAERQMNQTGLRLARFSEAACAIN